MWRIEMTKGMDKSNLTTEDAQMRALKGQVGTGRRHRL